MISIAPPITSFIRLGARSTELDASPCQPPFDILRPVHESPNLWNLLSMVTDSTVLARGSTWDPGQLRSPPSTSASFAGGPRFWTAQGGPYLENEVFGPQMILRMYGALHRPMHKDPYSRVMWVPDRGGAF